MPALRLTVRRALGRYAAIVVAFVVAIGAPARPLTAQMIMAAPQAVVVSDRTRTGALTLVNPSERPVEVELSTLYGYPVTDAVGRMSLRTFDAVDDSMPSAARWVRFFPERLVLPALGRRTVRLLVSPPAGVRNGEYWSRIVVTARGARVPVADSAAPGIAVGLALEVRSVLGMFYRHGPVATGVQMDSVHFALEGDSLVMRARLTREGSAAFVGSLHATVRDEHGSVRAESALPLGVYYALEPRMAMPTRHLPSGRYLVTVEAASERPDVPPAAIVQAPTQRRTFAMVVP